MESKTTEESTAVGSKQQVKDLLSHMDPMIYLAGTADNTSEMLMYLADMDPSFHKLQLVKSLRTGMRESLGTTIEEYVDKYLQEHKGKMHAENPVDYLVGKVVEDCKFSDFVQDTKSTLETSIQNISENFDDEIVTGMFGSDNDEDRTTYSVSPNESNESSLNSSLNQSGLMFLHPAQYDNIAQSLTSKRDDESRIDSLNILISVSPGEPVMQEVWPDIRKGLRDCLFEEWGEVSDKSLKVHCRLLTSQVHNAVKEAYINLLEAVAGFYLSRQNVVRVPVKGERVNLKTCENMIRILKVLIEFQNELPLIWIRYPERYVDDMVEATFRLLALKPQSKDLDVMTVLDMYGVVDPEATWLKRWVHGQWGRNKTFTAMRSNSAVLLNSVSHCIGYVESSSACLPIHTEPGGECLSGAFVSYLRFIHGISLVLSVLSFVDGRKLFPVNVPTKGELVTVQGMLQTMVKAMTNTGGGSTAKLLTSKICDMLCRFCFQDQSRCSVVCDAGIVETLLQGITRLEEGARQQRKEDVDVKFYQKAVVRILDSVTSTRVGQRYILVGRKRKPSSRSSGLSGISNSLATEALDLILSLMRSKRVGSDTKHIAVSVCSSLLSSPIGIHACIDHPLIDTFIQHLKERCRGGSLATRLQQDEENSRSADSLVLSVPQSLPLLTTLLLSYRGVFLLEREGVLSLSLSHVIPELVRKGNLTPRILSYISSSQQGCSVLGDLNVVPPMWDILRGIVKGEDLVQGRPLLQEEREEAVREALSPLHTLMSTFQGTRMVFSGQVLQEPLSDALFSLAELDSDLHTIAQQLLVCATAVPDSVAFLQASLGYQDHLLAQQMQMRAGEGESIAADENSILRNHTLVKSYMLGGSGERILPPHTIDSIQPGNNNIPVLFGHYPPPRDYVPEKPIRSMHKKQSDVWRFLSDTRHGLHDVGWIGHCRKAVCSVLKSGEEIKSWLVMDLLDRTVRALLSSPEELLPGYHVPQPSSPGSSLPSPTVSSKGWTFTSGSSSSPVGSESHQSLQRCKSADLQDLPDFHSVASELVLRYGSELQLVTCNGSMRENLMDVLRYTHSVIHGGMCDKCDWFAMALFLVYGGNVERCVSALTSLQGLIVGPVVWPGLADSLSHPHKVLPGEMVLTGIIHNAQLILSIEIPTLCMALQSNDECVWGVLGEWVRCVYLGVLPWTEVCHYLVLVLLLGPDYTIYFMVALVRHLQDTIISQDTTDKALLLLQTSVVTGWHVGEQLAFMEGLCRRYRRTVLPALTKLLLNT